MDLPINGLAAAAYDLSANMVGSCAENEREQSRFGISWILQDMTRFVDINDDLPYSTMVKSEEDVIADFNVRWLSCVRETG